MNLILFKKDDLGTEEMQREKTEMIDFKCFVRKMQQVKAVFCTMGLSKQ